MEKTTFSFNVQDTDAFPRSSYPGDLVAQGFIGYLRDQRTAQIVFHPVQYDAQRGEIRIFTKLRAEIRFENPFGMQAVIRPQGVAISKSAGTLSDFDQLMAAVLINNRSLTQ